MPNAKLAYQVLDHIRANPNEWTQQEWACDTRACFAGWAVTADAQSHGLDVRFCVRHGGGYVLIDGHEFVVRDAAMAALGITSEQAAKMFSGMNGLAELERYVLDFFGPRPDPEEELEVVESEMLTVIKAAPVRAAIGASPTTYLLDLQEHKQVERL